MFVTKYIIVGPNQLGYMVIPRHKVQSKIHKLTFCTIVSSIGAYNYKLAKFLGELFNPTIPSQHCYKFLLFLQRNTRGKWIE